ncbi:hypothetical protein [Pseudomonas sp. TE3610]
MAFDKGISFENALSHWSKKHSVSNDFELELKAKALELAIACINDGSLRSLDGVDSPLSQVIKKLHGVHLIEMNSGWVETSQDWCCPCCGRSKLNISRVGAKNQILAKLVIHHDHMEDALKAAFYKAFINSGVSEGTRTGLAFIERMAPAFSAYPPVLICEDCNNVDGKAKLILRSASCSNNYFSFSIFQLRKFIVVSDNCAHKIDESKLFEVWGDVKNSYVSRMKLIYQVALAAATQDYWYERYPEGFVPIPTLSNGHGKWGGLDRVSGEELSKYMRKKSIQHQTNFLRWRTESRKSGKQPPVNFLSVLMSRPGCATMWNSLPDGWKCSICCRGKFEVVSFENERVSFQTHTPTQRSVMWKGIGVICMSCCSVVKAMRLELWKGNGCPEKTTFDYISPCELRGIIISRPHSSHLVKAQEARALVKLRIEECFR